MWVVSCCFCGFLEGKKEGYRDLFGIGRLGIFSCIQLRMRLFSWLHGFCEGNIFVFGSCGWSPMFFFSVIFGYFLEGKKEGFCRYVRVWSAGFDSGSVFPN